MRQKPRKRSACERRETRGAARRARAALKKAWAGRLSKARGQDQPGKYEALLERDHKKKFAKKTSTQASERFARALAKVRLPRVAPTARRRSKPCCQAKTSRQRPERLQRGSWQALVAAHRLAKELAGLEAGGARAVFGRSAPKSAEPVLLLAEFAVRPGLVKVSMLGYLLKILCSRARHRSGFLLVPLCSLVRMHPGLLRIARVPGRVWQVLLLIGVRLGLLTPLWPQVSSDRLFRSSIAMLALTIMFGHVVSAKLSCVTLSE